MWVGLGQTRVTELWIPPRVPVTSEPGMFRMRSWAWYIITMPGRTRWLTTARAAMAPLALYSSIQSLSTTPMARASSSDIHTIGPPRDRVCISRLSL
ncbi:hypothetical protein D3C80_1576310 [compost metagenome]